MAKKNTVSVPVVKPKYNGEDKSEYKEMSVADLHSDWMLEELKEVSENTPLVSIMLNYPQLGQYLTDAGMHCIGCPAASYESLGDGCMAHGMNPTQVKKLISTLNKGIKAIRAKKEKELQTERRKEVADGRS